MAGRSKPVKGDLVPAPSAYNPQITHKPKDPSYTMASRTSPPQVDSGPPPNSYTLPAALGVSPVSSKASAASYTMAARSNLGGFADDLAKSPGPGKYQTPTVEVHKARSPSFSMGGRTFMPGGQYLNQKPGTCQRLCTVFCWRKGLVDSALYAFVILVYVRSVARRSSRPGLTRTAVLPTAITTTLSSPPPRPLPRCLVDNLFLLPIMPVH